MLKKWERRAYSAARRDMYMRMAVPIIRWLRLLLVGGAVLSLAASGTAMSTAASPARPESLAQPVLGAGPVPKAVAFNSGEATGAAPQLRVSGNMLVNAHGRQIALHGANRSGTEYMCVDGYGIFDGPSNQASVTAMKGWHVNAVRIPLNEGCWDGDSYVNPSYASLRYQHAIEAYVHLLNANGLVAILDLHWSDGLYDGPQPGCDSPEALCQKPMPDRSSVEFWKSVAHAFGHNDSVIFDLFNEPFPTGGNDNTASWQCWLNGGTVCTGLSYTAVGMQALVNAVRSAGATNVLMIGGPAWANDLSRWLAYEPQDPLHDLVASWHSYSFNACNTAKCWNSQVAPVLGQVPVVAGEIGENDCSDSYITGLMSWMDAHLSSYLAFTWDDWPGGCGGEPALIGNYSGTPTPYGSGFQAHLAALADRQP